MDTTGMTKQELADHINTTQNTELKKEDFTRDELLGLLEDYEQQQPTETPKIKEENAKADERNKEATAKRTKEKKSYPRRVSKNIIQTGKSGLSTG